MQLVNFNGYLFSDICCDVSSEECSASEIEETLTDNFDGTNLQYLIMYMRDVIPYYDDEEHIQERLKNLHIEDDALIFVTI